jgi:hypothetical protein
MSEKQDKPTKKKKKRETSKLLAWWAVGIATAAVVASYVLAALGLDTNESLTITIFTTSVAYLVAYAGKSLSEKMSRNKHGLGASGLPYSMEREESQW